VIGIAVVAAAAALFAITAARSGLGVSLDPRGTGCRGFWGETVQATAWSRDGRFLAIASTGANSLSTTRVFEWPGMRLASSATTGVGTDYAAVAEDGTIYWMTTDPLAGADSAMLWGLSPGGEPESLGPLGGGPYLSLTWAGGSLAGVEARPYPEASRLVRLSVGDPTSSPVAITDWMDLAGDEWVDRAGEWVVWVEPNVPSDGPQQVVVRNAGIESRITLPGYGGRVPTLTPRHDAAIHQRSETARLTVIDLATGDLRGELDDRTFFGGEVSAQSILAAPPLTVPGRPTSCASWTLAAGSPP
jgi:hypothetical protein